MKLAKHLLIVSALVLGLATSAFAVDCPSPIARIGSFDFLVDYSGSMMMRPGIGKTPKMEVAKKVLIRINQQIPALSYSGAMHTFAPFGEVVAPGTYDRNAIQQGIDSLSSEEDIYDRLTPMGEGLYDIAPILNSMPETQALILVSDGAQNQGVDPIEEMTKLYTANPDLVVHIISLADTADGKATLDAIHALKGNGVYVDVKDLLTDDAAVDQFVRDVFYTCPVAATDEVLVLQSVQFALDSAVLTPASKSILDEVADIINERSGQVEVAGYTCSLGSDSYNMALSIRRADAVKDYLVSRGVDPDRLIVKGFGKTHPKYDNQNPKTRPLNRRVELSFL